ncbi:SpoIID/LytB domain-containing protein [Patescibacteria group bacterium]|nr:SpoIID/LytB domain-containing protein [Patescibacteria group bacterium]MBU1931785.1 SpoIID/LytB domain-containing protein [Patescibacteria group bacterium]
MKKLLVLAFGLFLIMGLLFRATAYADKLSEIEQQIAELSRAREMSEAATQPLEIELSRLDQKLTNIENSIEQAKQNIVKLEQSIVQREKDFTVQYAKLSQSVASYYKNLRQPSAVYMLFSSGGSSTMIRDLAYRAAVADEDKKIIARISEEIISLENDKQQVEADKARLAGLQLQVDKEAAFFRKEVAGAKAYQTELSQQIAELTVKQQQILAEKAGTFQTTVGDVPLADDPASRPDYNPGFSPVFAAFSFGAPHFKGMSQYGAYGRAKSGQSAEEILRAYYGSGIEIKKDYSTDIQINVEGYGVVDIETYTKRIYEMPASWTDNDSAALKAQAVAARSYALARTNNGAGSICATESCQVYKPVNKGGAWDAAVDATRGWVLMANGQPFSAWYASTSGGYQESYSHNGFNTPGFWDTTCGNQGCWTGEAYEKIAGSPWFYKGWYKSRSGDSCGRSHPWLTAEEMADVLNAWVVLIKHGQSDDRVTPIGGCWGGNPYSINELRDRAAGLSVGYSRVESVSVTYAANGITANLVFQTDKDSREINGLDFKKAFNLRAPGRIALKSGLFNIEKK